MNYTNWTFWLLFAAVILPYRHLSHRRQNHLLLVASYIFYGFWDYRFLFLILLSTLVDFIGGLGVAGRPLPPSRLRSLALLLIGSAFLLCSPIQYDTLWAGLSQMDVAQLGAAWPGNVGDFAVPMATAAVCLLYGWGLPRLYALPEARRRKTFLAISMVANLAILGFFKYCDFFIDGAIRLAGILGFPQTSWSTLGILLPAGISFYTFQAMSYTIDIYRGQTEATDHFADFALFVCFFPHLVAGPIMRAHTLLPQVLKARAPIPHAFEEGLLLVLMGLFKKVVIADNMAPIVNDVFLRFSGAGSAIAPATGAEVWVGLYAFAFQIYADFSGYSSIARGVSKWLDFELVVNFHLPYLSVSPSDFWRRWHISLSTWLRDYLYIPLGGNREGTLYRNLMITMLLGGLWHGSSWTFIVWGGYHGALLCLFRRLGVSDDLPRGQGLERMIWAGRVLLMFHLTCIGWLLFRAESLEVALRMSRAIWTDFQWSGFATSALIFIGFYAALLFILEGWLDGEHRLERLIQAGVWVRGPVYAYLIAMVTFFPVGKPSDFIYFQF
jgi:D-alanyl-lipoteichoic acid acyltransferase DltB (MBOAT superfamily)